MTFVAPTPPPRSVQLDPADALLWNIERDPALRTTIVAISVLDRCPDPDRLAQRLTDAAVAVPRLRQRVIEAPLSLGLPRWQTDEQFDIGYHLRHVTAPGTRDLRAVMDLAAPIAMAAFDKDRPLWEFTLVDGLDDGRAVLIQKVHHAFTDGVGAVRLARLLFDDRRNAARRVAPADGEHPRRRSSGMARSWGALQSIPGLTARAATDPIGAVRTTMRSTRSIGRMLAPTTTPLSTVMTGRGLSRRLDAFDVPLDRLLAAAHAVDGTLNDAFLAGIAGGLHRYHAQHGAAIDALRVTMPVNLRREGDAEGSNHFSPVRFALPVATTDPTDRMREIGALTRSWRREPALPLTDVLAGVLDRLPMVATTALFGSMLKGVDLVATNVPGLTDRAYLAGAEVTAQYAFAPPSGAAMSIALLSHVGSCTIGLNIDTAAVPDPDLLTGSLVAGFDEVLASGPPAGPTRPARRARVRS